MINPAGKRLLNSFTYLQPPRHTTQRSCLGAAQSCPGSQPLLLALPRALQEREARLGEALWCRDMGPAQAWTQAGFQQHFTISKCILPHQAHWARTFFLLLSSWDIDLIRAGAFLTHREKSARVILWFLLGCRGFPDNGLLWSTISMKSNSSQCRLRAGQLGIKEEYKYKLF